MSWLDSETGEPGAQKLVHANGDARKFYQGLAAPVLIGMEGTGNGQWFVELAQDMGHEIWVGDAAQIRASYVRKQKTDKRDVEHIPKLVAEGQFPRLCARSRGTCCPFGISWNHVGTAALGCPAARTRRAARPV